MERCDVLIVGAGPAGSSCAWGLRGSGLDVMVLDRKAFPRDKICAGWVTPQVFAALDLDTADYRKERVLQPISGFAVERAGSAPSRADLGRVVSYGIRRCEFDRYLLERSGARLVLGRPLEDVRREAGHWIVNGEHRARWLVGAGGHFCPVARHLGANPGAREPMTVLASEIEFEMTAEQQLACGARGELPELTFAADLAGYGWVVRKGDWLNVGLGRQDPAAFPRRVEAFLDRLEAEGRLPPGAPRRLKGHAYLLYGEAPRPIAGDAALLVGDAAGLAYGRSGEGIRPAVESGLLAARALAAAGGASETAVQRAYEGSVRARFGRRHGRVRPGPTSWLPRRWRGPVAGWLLAQPAFARRVVIEGWFLQRDGQRSFRGLPPRR